MKPLQSGEIYGNWATLLLATDKNGDINYSKLNDEIDVLILSNPNGIYSNGTAGEFYSQTEEEFLKVNELLAAKCEKAGIPFQIGVSHMSPQISLQRLKMIKHLLPGAVQIILPDWFPPTLEESIIFLQKMAEQAGNISMVLYNPPHAKKKLQPEEWTFLKKQVPSLMGVKVFDYNSDKQWYESVRKNSEGLSVFIPGHNLATGITLGAHGAYSNVACLNPFTAQKWFNQIQSDLSSALELEKRIKQFMSEVIEPFISKQFFPNHACDRFMALVGGWADVGANLRWPYKSIPDELTEPVRKKARKIIPEFF
ncbi:dihydrodipicolinate synthase family protein [Maribellus comscasis]|uniref:Dihydrodipicolinate synthase family protein n=1 Tax=Maribellus comscasis TaxID=2681766 RepID=A0A6I6JVZ3_9BACT|nr:dihydrodipicolinate synthase family protein [Maribellus comscasis]QGY44257.1 dihydrodipicolinate synthase family protein [Maribellus comscasis]